ncbi:MAG TPA: sigma-54 dependent transcriptional regulator [Bacteroidales bacterium]
MKLKARILIVDDNEELLMGLKMFLTPHVGEVVTLKNPNQLLSTIQNNNFDLILLDMNFTAGVNSGNEGLYWMKRVLEVDSTATIVLITGFGDVELAVKAMREGAIDFIQKSWDEEKILSSVLNAMKIRESKMEITSLKNKQKHLTEKNAANYDVCIGKSAAMQKVFTTIEKVAKTDANILILGENGTGKEVIAREIHRQSSRSSEIFVTVDLASLPESLFESELFGYKKGAFTDAKEDKPGRFEIASGGTLFLDEIGNLSMPMQSKILSALQNREVTPLGSSRKVNFDVRLISATNAQLYAMVDDKTFREDLLYRINTIQIELPPLRDRKEDIPSLVIFFLKKYCEKYGKTCTSINPQALDKLVQYSWPGNVRELKHIIEKAVILSDSCSLEEADFMFNVRKANARTSENYNLQENEKQLINAAIDKYQNNLSHAAKALGINRSTLYEKIKRYGL